MIRVEEMNALYPTGQVARFGWGVRAKHHWIRYYGFSKGHIARINFGAGGFEVLLDNGLLSKMDGSCSWWFSIEEREALTKVCFPSVASSRGRL
jgi:hypothetical protein